MEINEIKERIKENLILIRISVYLMDEIKVQLILQRVRKEAAVGDLKTAENVTELPEIVRTSIS